MRRHKAARSLPDRCRTVPRCPEGLSNKAVSAELGRSRHTVGKWRKRFAEHRIEALSDETRAGRPRSVPTNRLPDVIKRTLETAPKDATDSSIRSLAAETSLSHTAIRRIRSAFKLSDDPLLVDEMQDVVRLYMSSPDLAIVRCVDEKFRIEVLDRTEPVLPVAPGIPEHRMQTYACVAPTSLFAALDIATGAVIGKCCKRHRATGFLDFFKQIDRRMQGEGPEVHLVMDNHATNETPRVRAWLAGQPHWHIHVKPTSASWLNRVARWFAEFARKQIQRGVHRSVEKLETDIWFSPWRITVSPTAKNGSNSPMKSSLRQALLRKNTAGDCGCA
ncbi:IS630 family transposase [Roseovarius sp. D22-M7]|uniref:IS630 family transposase n=1 Tax=Roseovarius sp. D22-M7 TaxID=3127116 RepID=UPI003FA723EA